MNAATTTIAAPPSRNANPFATCWTRPGALPWCGDVNAIVERLIRSNWRGQVVGPHGSGKTTLLRALVEPLRQAGKRPVLFDSLDAADSDGDVLLVEAFERLPRREQWRRITAWRRAGVGFVVTTHRTMRSWFAPLRVIAEMQPDETVVVELFERLTKSRPTPVTNTDALACFASRAGDLRETWFDLYLRHEELTRGSRTLLPTVAYSQRKPALQDGSATPL
jgi:energy-coupling factor transporter ATP-binding protein EcfA2